METVLNELMNIPGLTGAFVYQAKGDIMENTLPSKFTPAKIQAIGKVLSKIHAAGSMNFPDLSDIVLSFDEFTIFVRDLSEKAWVVLVGEPTFNVNMAAVSLHVIMEDLKDALAQGESERTQVQQALEPAPKPTVSPKELMESQILGPVLHGMLAALAKVVGPMAGIIFMECLERWAEEANPQKENLPKLLNMLVHETGDASNAARYRKLVEPLL
jgi:hypothetical protein